MLDLRARAVEIDDRDDDVACADSSVGLPQQIKVGTAASRVPAKSTLRSQDEKRAQDIPKWVVSVQMPGTVGSRLRTMVDAVWLEAPTDAIPPSARRRSLATVWSDAAQRTATLHCSLYRPRGPNTQAWVASRQVRLNRSPGARISAARKLVGMRRRREGCVGAFGH